MDVKTMELLFQLITGLMIPFIISVLKQVHWSPEQKFMITFVLSTLAASIIPLLKMGSDPFNVDLMLQSLTVIFTTSQVIYRAVLKNMSLEEIINPQAALASAIRYQIIPYLLTIDKKTAADILNPDSDKSIEVNVQELN